MLILINFLENTKMSNSHGESHIKKNIANKYFDFAEKFSTLRLGDSIWRIFIPKERIIGSLRDETI